MSRDSKEVRLARYEHATTLARVRRDLPEAERERGGGMAAACALASAGFAEECPTGPTRPALLFESEDDRLGRLEYADWCDEVGLCARAWLIREQIEGVLPEIVIEKREVATPDGRESRWFVNTFRGPEVAADRYYWGPAAVDAAAPIMSLPFVRWVVVRGGFAEMVRVDQPAAWWRYGPYVAASFPVWNASLGEAAPAELVFDGLTRYRWYACRDDQADLLALSASRGYIPEEVYHQTAPLGDVARGIHSTAQEACECLAVGAARWAAAHASILGLFPAAASAAMRAGRCRHASRPLCPKRFT